jgi:tetratricopeptide (TPR) repeat protein
MPFLQHKGVGQHFVFARSDHTIPIPRPTFDEQLGIENACQKCHGDKDIAWQEEKVRLWYGETKPHAPAIAASIRGREFPDPGFAKDLLLLPEAKHPMAQMQGLATFIRRFVRPAKSAVDTGVIDKLREFALQENLDLKALALMALQVGSDERPEVRLFLRQQLESLGTNAIAIRARWAIAADDFGNALAANNDPQSALVCLMKSLEIDPKNVVTLSHLAFAHLRSNDPEKAISTLREAIAIKPSTANLYFQLAQIQMELQQIPQAIESLQQGLQYAPEDHTAKFLLGKLRAL